MGTFVYGSTLEVEFNDRVLAHVQVVIGAKLRRSEGFYFTWIYALDSGSGRTTAWVHPAATLQFRFAGSREAQLNRQWLEALTTSANSARGLVITPEPGETDREARTSIQATRRLGAL